MELEAVSRVVPIDQAWRTWFSATMGTRGSWVKQISEDNEWTAQPGDIPTFLDGLRAALEHRARELEADFYAKANLPSDVAARQQVIAAAMPKRLERDALYRTTREVLTLFVDAHRANETVVSDPYV